MKAIILLMISVFITPVWANSLVVGDSLAVLTLQDQFGADYVVDGNIKRILFSRSMDGGTIIQTVLKADPQLPKDSSLIYVADISAMPPLVGRYIAIPQFKKFTFRMALDSGGDITKMLPEQADQATLIDMKANKVINIRFFDATEPLLAALNE
ncbi:hypothetical protein [Shewanella youngdeokensis]|uniref:FAD/FMN-containing dehydrogenase n=1 Tax=Shewanella youngdeokensis TaxID=2999068 RepID=A0ABZ0JYY2_9GAMM|nr:hypothetical protein RGE70_01300 [Shewanella sp. DAU334]